MLLREKYKSNALRKTSWTTSYLLWITSSQKDFLNAKAVFVDEVDHAPELFWYTHYELRIVVRHIKSTKTTHQLLVERRVGKGAIPGAGGVG